ncbi:MAG: hypothetical protein AB1505_25125, partial [Candidatus Latescibacterota bacterium]
GVFVALAVGLLRPLAEGPAAAAARPRAVDLGEMAARLATALPLPEGLAGSVLLLVPLAGGLWTGRHWQRNPRHALAVLYLAVPCAVWLLLSRRDTHLLVALVGLCALCAMGLRQFPRWARQGLWAGVALAYVWSYWHVLGRAS